MRNQIHHVFEFGSIKLDATNRLLYRDGLVLQVQPRVVETLLVLVKNANQIVDKDTLINVVWRDLAIEEGGLKRNISLLRKALGDEGRFIETLPKRGYRFSAAVKENWESSPFQEMDEPTEFVLQRRASMRLTHEEETIDSSADESFSNAYPAQAPRTPLHYFVVATLAVCTVVSVVCFSGAVGNRAAPTVEAPIRSIAVLPLRDLNANAATQTLSLGLTDSLITRLGKLNQLAVRPFSAVEKFKDGNMEALSFARELKADAVLEGTIQQFENRLRVNLRLINVRDGRHIWSESIDESSSDILKLEDAISAAVARAVLSKLDAQDRLMIASRPTANQEAYRLYLTGREKWMRREWERDCLAFYHQAIELDPNFALPYLGIADLYAFTYETKLAEDALAKAIELDPTLHEAYATRGFLQMFHHWDWAAAEDSFRRAIALAPNSAKAHHWYGVYLSIRGRLDEAGREMERALELDPTALVIMTDMAELHYFQHDYERAELELKNVLAMDPTFLNARVDLIKIRYMKGASYFRENAEFQIFRQRQRVTQSLPPDNDAARLEALLEKPDETALIQLDEQSLLRDIKINPPAYLALAQHYSVRGEIQKSLAALNRACDAKVFVMPFIAVDPLWERMREESRFQEILGRMKLGS